MNATRGFGMGKAEAPISTNPGYHHIKPVKDGGILQYRNVGPSLSIYQFGLLTTACISTTWTSSLTSYQIYCQQTARSPDTCSKA